MEVQLSEKCFAEILKLVHDFTGITIAKNRTSMIEGRLRKRVMALGCRDYDEYLRKVRENQSEQTVFIDLVTTNETSFFRTPRIWEYLEKKFLPTWFEAHPKKVFMAWSAAASSGEEAHSIAMICQDFKEKNPAFLYQIFGTDISQEMVGLCRGGNYSGRSLESFRLSRPDVFAKYMRESSTGVFQGVPEIRSRLKFQTHNLFHALPAKEKFDLILIRNVLIYFSAPDQRTVIELLAPNLSEDGALIIGESESLSHIETSFKSVEPLVYRLKPQEQAKAG